MKDNAKQRPPSNEVQPSAYTVSGGYDGIDILQKKENKTGLPGNLKNGLENLSGYDMSHVRVHFNSSKPAQLKALAFAQGSDIHLGPGQEKHLPHEGWHVVQQMQGRVNPTIQLKKDLDANYDVSLEKEADLMGMQALTNEAVAHAPNHQLLQSPSVSSQPMPFQFTFRDARKYVARTKEEFAYPEEWEGYPSLEQLEAHIAQRGVNWREISERLNAPVSILDPKRKTADEGSDPEKSAIGKKVKKLKGPSSREGYEADLGELEEGAVKKKKKGKRKTTTKATAEKEPGEDEAEVPKSKKRGKRRRAKKVQSSSSSTKKEALENEARALLAKSKSKKTKEEIEDDSGKESEESDESSSSSKKIAFGSADNLSDFIKYLSETPEGTPAMGPQSFLGEIEGYDWLARHRQLIQKGDLTKLAKGKKTSQNQVRCTVSLTVEGEGGRRVISFHVPKTFISGEKGMNIKNVKKWLVEKNILGSEQEYQSTLHAHSEQDMSQYFRDPANLAAMLNRFQSGMEEGEQAVGLILDFVSAPNTVCTPCHDSVDAVVTEVIVPYLNKALKAKLTVVVNASAFGKFKGGGAQETDSANWVETTVDYEKIKKSEEIARQKAGRDRRRSRPSKPSSDPKSEKSSKKSKKKKGEKSGKGSEKPKRIPAPGDLRARVEDTFGAIVDIDGEGLNCYIRAIVTGLHLRGILGEFPVEDIVTAIDAELEEAELRDEDGMIDAGGLDAELVRRAIAFHTQHIIHGGIDVGITIVQWDRVNGAIATYTANEGTTNLTLFYTPGHFDYITTGQ
jgi:hypothetical protein